jgi:hypothetical protein
VNGCHNSSRFRLERQIRISNVRSEFLTAVTINNYYILLTVHHVMILGKWPTWRTILSYVFTFIFNSLHVSSTSCSSSGETNCVNTTSGNYHSVSVAVSCAGREFTSDLHTTQPPTATRGWYWHNFSHTTSEHGVSSITTADAHTSAASSRLNWRLPPPPDLNRLVRFAERRNLVSGRVPSHFKRSLPVTHLKTKFEVGPVRIQHKFLPSRPLRTPYTLSQTV